MGRPLVLTAGLGSLAAVFTPWWYGAILFDRGLSWGFQLLTGILSLILVVSALIVEWRGASENRRSNLAVGILFLLSLVSVLATFTLAQLSWAFQWGIFIAVGFNATGLVAPVKAILRQRKLKAQAPS